MVNISLNNLGVLFVSKNQRKKTKANQKKQPKNNIHFLMYTAKINYIR